MSVGVRPDSFFDWVRVNYTGGWYLRDNGAVFTDEDIDAMGVPLEPIWHVGETPVLHPVRRRLIDWGEMTMVCRTCREPSWAVTRHAAERHGVDVDVWQPLPGKVRPEWMHPDWT